MPHTIRVAGVVFNERHQPREGADFGEVAELVCPPQAAAGTPSASASASASAHWETFERIAARSLGV
ncbi:hypothetical protein [Streptomyces sp. NPDC050600]|uniref:hypothetical protein n=1 Tax=Streptomyces sp. NPDC050600 TaxID=3157213 RepID=UPI003444E5A6